MYATRQDSAGSGAPTIGHSLVLARWWVAPKDSTEVVENVSVWGASISSITWVAWTPRVTRIPGIAYVTEITKVPVYHLIFVQFAHIRT